MALTGEEKEIGMPFEAGLDDAPPPQKQETSAGGGDGGPSVIRYRECLKNHAASIGGNVTDGCGEFMSSGEEGTPPSLKCAACNCHRSFHRKETPNGGDGGAPQPTPPLLPSFASMTQRNNAWASLAAQSAKTPAAFGGCASATAAAITAAAAAADSSFQEPNLNAHQFFGSAPAAATRAKKRFRTKFTQEQKDKMTEFAETIGWRIPREEENINRVQRFCGEIGVKRQVFKVWMHNNKSSAKNNTSHLQSTSPSPSSSINN